MKPVYDVFLSHSSADKPAVETLALKLREAGIEPFLDKLVEVRKEFLEGVRPAITTVFVAGLVSPDWLVEVEVVACAE